MVQKSNNFHPDKGSEKRGQQHIKRNGNMSLFAINAAEPAR